MGIKKQSLVLVIKNPYEGSLKQDKSGKLISTKNDFRRHGYGISSIQKVADKYGGDVIIRDAGWKICSDSYDEYMGILTVRYVNLTDDKMKEKKFYNHRVL